MNVNKELFLDVNNAFVREPMVERDDDLCDMTEDLEHNEISSYIDKPIPRCVSIPLCHEEGLSKKRVDVCYKFEVSNVRID
jgi:hypothetical protein